MIDTNIDPGPVLRQMDNHERFLRMLPEPDATMCGRRLTDARVAGLAHPEGLVGYTACHRPPGHGPAHVALRVTDLGTGRWYESLAWLDDSRPLGTLRQRSA